MVKRKPKAEADAPQQSGGWGNMDHAGTEQSGGGNISDSPEDRRPLDEGWDRPSGVVDTQNSDGSITTTAAEPGPDSPKPKRRKGKGNEAEPAKDVPSAQGNVTTKHNGDGGRLTSFVERLERLAEEKQTIADDMKEVAAEAKAEGYDIGTLRKVLQRRRKGKDACDEADAILDLYEQQVGWPA